jgi:hypothetical protein
VFVVSGKDKRKTQLAGAIRQINAGKHAEAESLLSNLLTSYPGDPEVCRLLATLHLKRGQLQVALSEFKFLANAALRAQDYALAESMIQEYLQVEPGCIPLLELLGQVYEEKGDRDSASVQYGHVIERLKANSDPEWADLPRELYAKIKALVPGSPLAQKLAPFFEAPTPAAEAPAPEVKRVDEVPAPVVSLESEADFRRLVSAEPASVAPVVEPKEADLTISKTEEDHTETPTQQSAFAPREMEEPQTAAPTWDQSEPEIIAPSPEAEKPVSAPAPPPRFRLTETPSSFGIQPSTPDVEEPPPDPTVQDEESQIQSEVEPPTPVEAGGALTPARGLVSSTADEPFDRAVPEAEQRGIAPSARAAAPTPRKQRTTAPDYRTRYLRSRLRGWVTRTISAAGFVSRLIVLLLLLSIAVPIVGAAIMTITWLVMEQRPSQTFKSLATLPPQPIPDSKRNGYFLLLGLAGDSSLDPMRAGYERWQRVEIQRPRCTDVDENSERPLLASANVPELREWFRDLVPTFQFRQQRELLASWQDANRLVVSRYEQWLRMPFEDSGFGTFTAPDCAQTLAVHRLYLARGFSEDTEEGILRLELDMAAWRNVLAKSRSLSMKTLGLMALRDDVRLLSDLLSRPDLDSRKLPRLMRMAEPLDAAERSLRWPMLDEFLAEVKLQERRLQTEMDVDRPSAIQAVGWFPLPKQKALNGHAAYYDALIKASETASQSLPTLYEFSRTPPQGLLDYVMNPVDNLVATSSMPNWNEHAGAVLEMDARLRLAGLQARLRTPSKDQRANLLARIAEAGPTYYDPFTGFPMLTNGAKTMLYSIGPDRADNNGDPRHDITVPLFSAAPAS